MIASRVTLIAVLSVAGAAFVVASATAGGGKPQKRTVQIADNYYNPSKLTVNRGSTVSWKWPEVTGDSHDVLLEKGPKGVKRFQSESAGSGYTYRRKLTVRGEYRIICTLHEEEMTMVIRVRK